MVGTKKWSLLTMTVTQAAKNHRDESSLAWYLQWGIYTLIPTCLDPPNPPMAAEALSLNIFSYGTSP